MPFQSISWYRYDIHIVKWMISGCFLNIMIAWCSSNVFSLKDLLEWLLPHHGCQSCKIARSIWYVPWFFGGLQVGGCSFSSQLNPDLVEAFCHWAWAPPPTASLVAMCESHVRECNNSPARISLNHIDNIHNVNISGMDSQSKHLHSFCVWLATSSCNFSALFSRLSCLHVVQEKIKQLVPEICISVWVVVSHNNIITVATSRNRYFLRCFDVFS